MSRRCPDNFWIENGIIGNMNKLGIIAWDYEMFFHGSEVCVSGNHMVLLWNLFQGTIGVVAFGGIEGMGFGTFEWHQCVTTKIVASRYGGGGTRIKNYWKFSRRDKPRSDQRTTG